MMTHKLKKSVLALAGLALVASLRLQAATNTIFFDPFTATAGSALNGTSPKEHGGVGTDTWLAPDDGITLDGGTLTVTAGSRWCSLPFYPEDGNKYKISMDMNATHTGSDWFAIGFCDTPTAVADYGAQHMSGWYLIRGLNPGYPLHSFTGYATDGGGQAGNFTGPHKISVILDTSLDNWTFEYFVDDISQRGPVPFSKTPGVNPSIANVTFGSYGTARGIMDNFLFENIFHVVTGPPTIATQPKNASVVLGGTVRFEVFAAGPKPITYQWLKNAQELAGETASTLTIANLTAADSGAKFTVKVTNSYGTTTTDAATLTVLNVPGPLIHKFNFTDGKANDSVGGMTGAFKGTTTAVNGQLVSDGSDNGFVLLSDYAMPPAGSASVVAWFRASSSIGKSARVFDFGSGTLNYFFFTPMTDVGGTAKFGFKAGDDAEVAITSPALNDNIDHMVAAVVDSTPTETGLNGTMYLYIDGQPVGTNDLNGSITLANLDFGPQNYIGKSQWVNTGDLPFKGFIDEVRVYNTALSQSDIAALAPDANPASAPVIDTQPIDVMTKLGGSASFVVGVTGSKPLTYQWRLNGTDIAAGKASVYSIPSVANADFGAYSVVVANSLGSATSVVAQLSLSRWNYDAWTDDASTGVDTAYFYTHAYNFGTANNTEINGQAFTGVAGGNPSFANSFTLTGPGSVFNNDPNNIFADGTGSRVLGNDFIYGGNPSILTLSGLTPGKDYLLTLFSVAWDAPGARKIQFSAAGGQGILVDQNAYDVGNGIRITYQYTADASGSVSVTNTPLVAASSHHMYGFCNRLATKIPTGVAPTIAAQPQTTSAALNTPASFTVTVMGTAPLSYQWRFNGADIAGANSALYTIDSVQTANFGDYTVVASNTSGSVTSVVASLSLSRWTYEAWTDDASSGVDMGYYYSHAVNFGVASNATINGLTFKGIAGGNPAVLNSFTVAGMGNTFNNDANNLPEGSGSRTLANDFIYGGNPGTITLYDLVPGKEYLLTLFSVAFDAPGQRPIKFTAAGAQQLIVDQDVFDNDNGIRINFPYTADANGSVVITNTSIISGNTHHSYGFCNRLLNKIGTTVAPEIMSQPKETSAAVGAPASFAVIAIGPGTLSYQWRLNGANIAGATAASYTIDAVQTANFGSYDVVVSNAFGSATSAATPLSLLRFSAASWSDDASSGVDSSFVYTHAYSFGSANSTTINGVKFTGIAVGNPSVSNVFELTGVPNVYNNDGNNIPAGSGSKVMASDFIYGGNPGKLTLHGLTPGKQYLLTFYSMGWEDSGRTIRFVAANGQTIVVDQDTYLNNNGIRILYQYTADATGSVTVSSYQVGIGTLHTYGFSNRELTGAAPAPQLTITSQAGGSVVLSWPASFTGFILESAASLPATGWTPVAGVQNNQATVIHSKVGNQFFRLRKP